jgi:hypothetical protein
MFYIGYILGVWNGLIQFTLFLMGKFNSKVEQLESRTVSWNGLYSKFEVPLYIYYILSTLCIYKLHLSSPIHMDFVPNHNSSIIKDMLCFLGGRI